MSITGERIETREVGINEGQYNKYILLMDDVLLVCIN